MSEKKFLAEARVLKGISRYIEGKDDRAVEIKEHQGLISGHSQGIEVTGEAEVVETARSGGSSKRDQEGLKTHDGPGLQRKMRVNMLNTQKYSSLGQKAFNLNRVNNQLFGGGSKADAAEPTKRDARFLNQTAKGEQLGLGKAGGLSKSGKVVIHLNLRTPSNVSYQNNSGGPKSFFAKVPPTGGARGPLDQGSASHDNLLKFEETLQSRKAMALTKSNKSMLSTILGENIRMNRIQDSLANKGVQGQKPLESVARRLGSPGRTELRLNAKLLQEIPVTMLCATLRVINLSANRLSTLPEEICLLEGLQRLNLSGN